MSLPTSQPIPSPEEELPPARRRRMRRLVVPQGGDEQADVLDEIGKRSTPGAEFYISALLAGVVAGLGFLLDSPALVVLAVLMAPFMGPAIGIAIATVAGSAGFFARSLGSLVIGGIIFLLTGSLAGFFARLFPPATLVQASHHLAFDWTDLVLLTVGSAVTVMLMARSAQQRPQVSSVAVAYGVFLPLSAAGFSLASGAPLAWESGLVIFVGSLVWVALAGTVTLALLGLRPLRVLSYVLVGAYALACVSGLLVFILSSNAAVREPDPPQVTLPALAQVSPTAVKPSQPAPESTPAPSAAPDLDPTLTLAPLPTRTPEATHTLVPTRTPTITVTPQATPVWARINAKGSNGAYIREEPRYDALIVVSLLNGNIVEVLDEVQANDGATWVKVKTPNGKEGWIVRSLLATATPAPGW